MSNKDKKWSPEPISPLDHPLLSGADPQGEKVYTIAQAANVTGLKEKLIRQEIESGEIPIVELPGERRMMVRRHDLNLYIRARIVRRVEDEDQK